MYLLPVDVHGRFHVHAVKAQHIPPPTLLVHADRRAIPCVAAIQIPALIRRRTGRIEVQRHRPVVRHADRPPACVVKPRFRFRRRGIRRVRRRGNQVELPRIERNSGYKLVSGRDGDADFLQRAKTRIQRRKLLLQRRKRVKTGNIRHAVGGRGKNAARCGENAVLHVAAGQGDIDFDVAGLGVGGGRQGDGRNAALRAAAKRDGCAGAQVLDRAGNGGAAKVNGISRAENRDGDSVRPARIGDEQRGDVPAAQGTGEVSGISESSGNVSQFRSSLCDGYGGAGRYAAKYRNLRSLYAHDSTDARNWQENLISFELA